MPKYLVFDFETVDPYIERKLGAGWVYGIKVPSSDFEVIGVATKDGDEPSRYTHTKDTQKHFNPRNYDYLIAHNAQYDLGCATYLGWQVKDRPIIDTEVMARIYDSSLLSYSLDNLATRYLGAGKGDDALIRAIKENNLYPYFKYEEQSRARALKKGLTWKRDWSKHTDAKLLTWAKKNMKAIQAVAPDCMAEYACADTDLTWKLFNYFKERLSEAQFNLVLKYSNLSHICIDYRLRGVRVDLNAIRQAQRDIGPLVESKRHELFQKAGMQWNIDSPNDTGAMLASRGLEVDKQEADPSKYSVNSKWLEKQPDPLCADIIDYRKYQKIKRDFFDKLLDIQRWTVGPDAYLGSYGRIYPELNLLRARTGRFSSTGPNIQNIPVRHEVLGPMCRSFFIPEEGETWYSLDYSNQEGRLQVHYAVLLDCKGAEQIQREFNRDPNFDLHQWVAELCGIGRFDGKTINLGISYGMALNTLGQSLGVSRNEAKALKKKYNTQMPYLSDLADACEEMMKKKGRIKTLGGRLLRREEGFEYKTLNKLIQGSASDQTIEAMILAYERGIPILFPVHDELNLSTSNPQDAYDLQALMVKAYELEVPTVVDIGHGANWSECK